MIEDAARACLALADRLVETFTRTNEAVGSQGGARDLSAVALAIARDMQREAQVHLAAATAKTPLTLDSILALNQRARTAEELHAFLENSSHRSLHPALTPTVRSELEALGIPSPALVTGTRDVSYEVWTFDRDNFVGLVPDAELNTFKFPLLVFLVPNAPLDWPLHHILLYHELGHALLDARGGLPTLTPPTAWDPSTGTTPQESFDFLSKCNDYSDASESWLAEIYADAVGVCLAGPAYAVAFARLLGAFFSLREAGSSHPPLALRIRLIDRALKAHGFTMPPEFATLLDGWLALAKSAKSFSSDTLEQDVVMQLLTDVEAVFPNVLALAEGHVGPRRYDTVAFNDDLARGEALATRQIPPIEVEGVPSLSTHGTPLVPARIFGAAWCAYLRDPERENEARYADVVLGSLEGAEALRVWSM